MMSFTMLFVIFVSVLINVFAWMAIGYIVGSYFAKYSKCGTLCVVSMGVVGSLLGGLASFLAYGFPNLMLWVNNLLFAIVGAFGFVYISLPEKERAAKVEHIFRSFKRLNNLYVDLAGFKR